MINKKQLLLSNFPKEAQEKIFRLQNDEFIQQYFNEQFINHQKLFRNVLNELLKKSREKTANVEQDFSLTPEYFVNIKQNILAKQANQNLKPNSVSFELDIFEYTKEITIKFHDAWQQTLCTTQIKNNTFIEIKKDLKYLFQSSKALLEQSQQNLFKGETELFETAEFGSNAYIFLDSLTGAVTDIPLHVIRDVCIMHQAAPYTTQVCLVLTFCYMVKTSVVYLNYESLMVEKNYKYVLYLMRLKCKQSIFLPLKFLNTTSTYAINRYGEFKNFVKTPIFLGAFSSAFFFGLQWLVEYLKKEPVGAIDWFKVLCVKSIGKTFNFAGFLLGTAQSEFIRGYNTPLMETIRNLMDFMIETYKKLKKN